MANRYSYDPYGSVTSSSGTASNPWQFGGRYGAYTDGTGLVKIGQRYYDPGVGRWMQQDPLPQPFSPAGANRYSYAGNSPCNYVDPSGLHHCSRDDTVAAGAVFAGNAIVAAGSAAAIVGTEGAAAVVVGTIFVGSLTAAFGAEYQFAKCVYQ